MNMNVKRLGRKKKKRKTAIKQRAKCESLQNVKWNNNQNTHRHREMETTNTLTGRFNMYILINTFEIRQSVKIAHHSMVGYKVIH